jgi:CheY-like chemotaxis protein/HPt (histidine-containing phosphotransfer) domain-containing protein
VLEECTSLFASTAESKGIELVVCPPPPCERKLLGDPLRLRQVLMNLVGNAVKFTERGEVVVRADVASDGDRAVVRLAVADTGIGIDAAAVGKIFEPFAQADETTTRRFGGSGLGLAICRELSDLMGGEITVESQPGVGSTFHLSLPLALGEAIPRGSEPRRTLAVFTRRPSLAESVARHAALLGLDVLPAHAGDVEADVVVVDATTRPSTLGSLLATAGTSRSALVVIATSADVESRALRLLLPEEQIVLKPVHGTALREAFTAALGLDARRDAAEPASTARDALKGHVLLVEDEPVNAAVAEGYLAALGCTCTTVTSGAEAVACAAAERFDLIFMDLSMPGMDGFATTALIRAQQDRAGGSRGGSGRVPIVALTAHDTARYRDKCLAADMDDILSKPYTLDDCRSVLRRWLLRGGEASAPAVRVAAAETAPSADALASVDASSVAALRQLGAGKHADLYAKLVELFRSSSTQSLAELEEALEDADLPAAAAVAHKLASAAANVGGLAYASEVRRLEQVSRDGDGAAARELCERLRGAHGELLATLQSFSLRATA